MTDRLVLAVACPTVAGIGTSGEAQAGLLAFGLWLVQSKLKVLSKPTANG